MLKRDGDVAQLEEFLPKHDKALGSILSTTEIGPGSVSLILELEWQREEVHRCKVIIDYTAILGPS